MARMRKLLCAVLCVALVMCALCVPVFAFSNDYYTFSGTATFGLYDNGVYVGTETVTHTGAAKVESDHMDDHYEFGSKVAAKIAQLESRGYTVTLDSNNQGGGLVPMDNPDGTQEFPYSCNEVESYKATRTVEEQKYYPNYDVEEPAEQEVVVVEEPVEDVSPKTGDAGNAAAVVMLAAAAALCVCGAMLKRRSA